MTEQAAAPVGGAVPYLIVSDANGAIEFYKQAFGATEISRSPAPDGKKIMHAALEINGAGVMLMDDFPEARGGKDSTPEALGGTPVLIHLQVPDVDAVWQRALAAGATVNMPLEDQFWGDRYGQLNDPYGHTWSLATTVATPSDEEIARAAEQSFGQG